ncbi:HS12A-like protein [Mya arenaria]|uniref:HS12A-like protein n=2 Tax=Mya arenaria TaxID=6604 RepID=A0ABY7FZ90_MYAAR|nr:HS12A-like protein [Mya arenaria]
MTLTDEGGKQLPAITVFSLAIRYLKEDAMNESGRQLAGGLNPDDVHWVLTVPAIWDDEAKQFMREAAERADICSKNLTLALESEAAAIWCRFLPVKKCGDGKSLKTFKTGTKYLVVDAGGGTVDIAVQTVLENDMIENIHIPGGGDCGGTKVDEAYIQFLTDIVGQETMHKFKNTFMDDYIFLTRAFEEKKRFTDQSSRNPVVFRISACLPDLAEKCTGKKFDDLIKESKYCGQVKRSGDKLQTDFDIVTNMFAPQIDLIVDHISKLVEREIAKIEAILLVGGFSNCLMLQNAVKDRFGDSKTITVNDSDLAVMKGAVIFGHRPELITQRISKYTYGVKCNVPFDGKIHPPSRKVLGKRGIYECRICFDIHISAGQSIVAGEVQHKKTYKANTEKQTTMELEIYRTLSSKPVLVTDEGCHVAGRLDLPLAGRGLNREVEVQMIYGGTEIQVEAKEMATGKVHKCSIDFLN